MTHPDRAAAHTFNDGAAVYVNVTPEGLAAHAYNVHGQQIATFTKTFEELWRFVVELRVAVPLSCKKCGSVLDEDEYCTNLACPYADYAQDTDFEIPGETSGPIEGETSDNPLITYRDQVEDVKHKLQGIESDIAALRVKLAELQDDLNAESL